MIQRSMENEVIRYHGSSERVLPNYNGQSLSNIPNWIHGALTTQKVKNTLDSQYFRNIDLDGAERIVLFYIDGLSYDYATSRTKDIGFLGRMLRKGVVSPITAGFPTTTASSCTSLNTGLSPLEHGLIEWELYFHETGALIYTLPFRAVTGKYSSKARDLDPSALFSGAPVYAGLRKEGVRSFVLVNKNISRGSYSDMLFKGATIVPYSYITDCIIQLRNILEREKGPVYVYVYIESADSVGHTYGPETGYYSAELESISRIIRFELLDRIDPLTADNVLVLMTSDHGQVQIDPKETFYLNSVTGFQDTFEEHLGNSIPPVGSPRDVFLHIDPAKIDHAIDLLDGELKTTTDIITVKEAVDAGYFGSGHMHRRFFDRAGNLLLLPREKNTIWYRMKGQVPMHLNGLHGGMIREEMIVPFGVSRLSHLL